MAIDNTRQLIQQITNASSVGENTATRVGNAMEAMLNDVKAADDKANAATNRINTTEQGIANANQRLTTEEGVNATQNAQIEGLKQDLQNFRHVTIEGDVVNNPDNVFLTSVNDEITPKERTTSLSAKGHYIMRPTDNFAAKLKANYIHEIPFDVNLGGASVTIPANAVLKFTGGKISGGSLVGNKTAIEGGAKQFFGADVTFAGTFVSEAIKPKWFGAVSDGVTDNYNQFNAILSLAKCCDKARIEIDGTYKIIASGYNLNLNADADIVGTSKAASLEISGGTLAINNAVGAYTPLAINVSADIAKGSTTMQVSDVSALVVGDIITIVDKQDFSFYAERAGYRKGEMKVISAISGNVVTFTEPFLDNYTHDGDYTSTLEGKDTNTGRLLVSKINPITVTIRDLKFIGDGSHGCVRITGGYNCTVENVVMVGSGNYGIGVTASWNTRIDKCTVITAKRPVDGQGNPLDCYGISNGNSYYTTITNCYTTSGTHSITNGGSNIAASAISRYAKIIGCTIDTYNTSMSLDFHGNNEYYLIADNLIYKGMSAGGGHSWIRGNTIILPPSENNITAIWPYRRRDTDIVIEGNTIIVNVQRDAAGYVVDCAPSYDVTEQGIVRIANNKVTVYDNRATQSAVIFVFTFRSHLVERIVIEGNNVEVKAVSNPAIYAVYAIFYNQLRIAGNTFDGGLAVRENYDTIIMDNVIGKTSLYGINIDSYTSTTDEPQGQKTAHTLITGNFINDCGNQAIYERYVTHPNVIRTEIQRNIFGKVGTNQEIYIDCAIGSFIVDDNKCLGTKKAIALICDSVLQSGNNFTTITSARWNREKGTTAQRPTLYIMGGGLQVSDVGTPYFDTTLLKQIFFAAKLATTVTKNYFAAACSSAFDTNVLQSDTVYGIVVNRTGQRQLWASKVNDVFSEENAILLYDTSVNGDRGYIYTPDATVYPYVYMTNPASGSTCRFEIYAIDAMWVDANGTTA